MKTLTTLQANTRAVGSSAYFGHRGQWFIAAAITRDSCALERSNFRCMTNQLAAKVSDGENLQTERFGHWACGWIDYLLIAPDETAALELLSELLGKLEDYPVLNEEDFSDEEQREADETWKNCYDAKDRINYIRKFRDQFEFRSLGDALGCIRGNYFAGYASELLN